VRHRLFAYVVVPLFAVASAVAIRTALASVLDGDAPLLVLLLAVIISAWVGGFPGGLVATAVATAAGVFFFIPPRHSWSISDLQEVARVVLFVSEAVVIALLFDRVRRSEARARHATKRLEAFLTTVSHELRNSLGALVAAADVLARSDGSGKAAGALQRQVRHVIRLVGDLSDLSRLERGRLTLHRQRVPIGPILDVASEMAAPEFARRRQIYDVCAEATDRPLDVDPVRIQQVLTNLLINASRYSPSGSRIQLHATPWDGGIRITVSDTGRGIDPAEASRIFQPFTRAVQEGEGFGVGLAVARSIVEMHGGSIGVLSEGIGKGARFTIELPGTADEGQKSSPASTDQPTA
jgi:signal transduction histidine kinase